MSAAGRGPRRGGKDDFFETPPWCLERLLERWRPAAGTGGIWAEPAAGTGVLIRTVDTYLRATRFWLASEIRAEAWAGLDDVLAGSPGGGLLARGDFLTLATTGATSGANVVLTNPPYHRASQYLDQARRLHPSAEIVFLLRQGFVSSSKRTSLYREHGTPDLFALPNRPTFTSDGKTDQCDYAWFVWPPSPRAEGRLVLLAETPLAVRRPNGRLARGSARKRRRSISGSPLLPAQSRLPRRRRSNPPEIYVPPCPEEIQRHATIQE